MAIPPGHVQQERNCIRWVLEEINYGGYDAPDLALQPGCVWVGEVWLCRFGFLVSSNGRATHERGGEAPGGTDEEEADNPSPDWGICG